MASENPLSVEPRELKFNFELGKRSSCTVRLTNNTNQRLAFKVMTTNPKKYRVRPDVGIVSPKSSMNLSVTMRAPTKTPLNMKCNDEFFIERHVASSADSTESARKMFNDTWRSMVQCKLKVVYKIPSDRPSSHYARSETIYSPPDAEISSSRNLDDSAISQNQLQTQLRVKHEQGRSRTLVLNLIMKLVTIGLLVLVSYYLVIKILAFIWNLTFMLKMLVIKMVKKLVSDSVEDWIVKTILYAIIQVFSVIYRRMQNNNENRRSQ